MTREIRLNDCSSVLDEIEYPTAQPAAATEFSDVTLLLADGERNLGELISKTDSDTFESAADLEAELHNVLPRGAVGEPYQSEGDA